MLKLYICIFAILGAALASRPGSSTDSQSCHHVRSVPGRYRNEKNFPPRGISQFYQKYTEAYGIPVIAHNVVPDDAIKRACYVVRFMLADQRLIREGVFRMGGRVAIIGAKQKLTQIPEYSSLPDWWNNRARGLGATPGNPIGTGAEENILCYNSDPYRGEDIMLHEFAHTMDLLSIRYVIPGWARRVQNRHAHLKKANAQWKNTYALASAHEYFAEGTQSYFNVNAYVSPPNGIHNSINTRKKLRTYDPVLYKMVEEVFTCKNNYIPACGSTRSRERHSRIRMNCKSNSKWTFSKGSASCQDKDKFCMWYAFMGYCSSKRNYMKGNCKKSCNWCGSRAPGSRAPAKKVSDKCRDKNGSCPGWASSGECDRNPKYMLSNCKRSCARHKKDAQESCKYWSRNGECEKNPTYMYSQCLRSCCE